MHTLCKTLGLLFILILTGVESFVLISEFMPLYDNAFNMMKVVMAIFIFNTVLFIFASKYRDAITKIDERTNE